MQPQRSNASPFLSRYTYAIIALTLIGGIAIGYFTSSYNNSNEDASISKVKTIQFLITNGEETRSWNNVTLNEGESVAKILNHISEIEGINLTWDNDSKDQSIVSLMNKYTADGNWTYYVNNANPTPTIGRFYPKKGDVISIIYASSQR